MKPFNLQTLQINHCIKCDISLSRRSIVNSRGPTTSKAIVIGEAPGATEDKHAIPFIGNAGQLLRQVLRYHLIEPKDLYLTNTIKCKPNANRPPTLIECRNCLPYLMVEIYSIKPKVILTLGNTALTTLFPNSYLGISKERGVVRMMGDIVVIPTYHPSYILRNKSNDLIIQEFMNDIKLFQILLRYFYKK